MKLTLLPLLAAILFSISAQAQSSRVRYNGHELEIELKLSNGFEIDFDGDHPHPHIYGAFRDITKDANGRITQVRPNKGGWVRFYYNAAGFLTEVKSNGNSHTCNLKYNSAGKLIEVRINRKVYTKISWRGGEPEIENY